MFAPTPIFFGTPAPAPLQLPYHHLQAAQIRTYLNVPAGGPDGTGVKLAIVDTGFYRPGRWLCSRKPGDDRGISP